MEFTMEGDWMEEYDDCITTVYIGISDGVSGSAFGLVYMADLFSERIDNKFTYMGWKMTNGCEYSVLVNVYR
jgi:hypothetical protein